MGEVSFHMSGTEAVMAAVRCARFNKRRPLVVTFGGAYHGWWDGMQPAAGNERTPTDVLCLKDMNSLSLATIRSRKDEIAAVLVNPLQCFHLNASPPSDLVLSSNISTRQCIDHQAMYRRGNVCAWACRRYGSISTRQRIDTATYRAGNSDKAAGRHGGRTTTTESCVSDSDTLTRG